MKQGANGRMVAGWLRGRGRQETRADRGGGGKKVGSLADPISSKFHWRG